MKAAIYHGIKDIQIEEIATPQPGKNEMLVKVKAAGICGTDIKIFQNGYRGISRTTRRILGHEVTGEIVKVGSNIENFSIGQHVGIAPSFGCGFCDQCIVGWPNLCTNTKALGVSHNGGFAEYILLPNEVIKGGNVCVIPDNLSFTSACLAEPLSCCINGQDAVNIQLGDSVLIIGSGPIGIMHLLLSRLKGARKIIVSEINEFRLNLALENGADHAINPSKSDLFETTMQLTQGKLVNVVIVAVASPLIQQQAIDLCGIKGKVLYFAGLQKEKPFIQLDGYQIHYKQISIYGTTGSNAAHYRRALNLISFGKIKVNQLISSIYPLDQFLPAMQESIKGESLKIIIDPTQ